MSEVEKTDEQNSLAQAVADGGAYEVIRKRLLDHAKLLTESATSLNESRLAEFGETSLDIIGRVRVRTENNCIARDISLINDQVLFGYNVFIGLKKETQVSDVFGLYQLIENDNVLEIEPAHSPELFLIIHHSSVISRNSIITIRIQTSQTSCCYQHLLATFQIGERISDVKVFRWSIDNEGNIRYIDNRGERDIPTLPAMTLNGLSVSEIVHQWSLPSYKHP